MNIYKILMTHAAPKDYEIAIKEYVIAEDDKAVFNYLKNESEYVSSYWTDIENNGDIYYDDIKKIDFIFENNGESKIESNWDDLYYGSTMYDWELFKENINDTDIEVLTRLKIARKA